MNEITKNNESKFPVRFVMGTSIILGHKFLNLTLFLSETEHSMAISFWFSLKALNQTQNHVQTTISTGFLLRDQQRQTNVKTKPKVPGKVFV